MKKVIAGDTCIVRGTVNISESQNRVAPGGIIATYRGTIVEINKKENGSCEYKLKITDGDNFSNEKGIIYESVTCAESIRSIGDNAYIVYNVNKGYIISGDTIIYHDGSVLS